MRRCARYRVIRNRMVFTIRIRRNFEHRVFAVFLQTNYVKEQKRNTVGEIDDAHHIFRRSLLSVVFERVRSV